MRRGLKGGKIGTKWKAEEKRYTSVEVWHTLPVDDGGAVGLSLDEVTAELVDESRNE